MILMKTFILLGAEFGLIFAISNFFSICVTRYKKLLVAFFIKHERCLDRNPNPSTRLFMRVGPLDLGSEWQHVEQL